MINIRELYFEWLLDQIFTDFIRPLRNKYTKLMCYLFNAKFYWSIPRDSNRFEDGVSLRDRFIEQYMEDQLVSDDEFDLYFNPTSCSVLEMMAALAIRCEDTIMYNPDYGNRTGKWFWIMIKSMNLHTMDDRNYNEIFVENTVARMLDREYAPNGEGGLFTIPDCQYDLRDVEIWYQMSWFIAYISEGE